MFDKISLENKQTDSQLDRQTDTYGIPHVPLCHVDVVVNVLRPPIFICVVQSLIGSVRQLKHVENLRMVSESLTSTD